MIEILSGNTSMQHMDKGNVVRDQLYGETRGKMVNM